MDILIRNRLRKTPVYDLYWRFAYERQNVFFSRLLGNEAPWTKDSVIRKYKFTNTYRVLDRVSQYLICNIINVDHDAGICDDEKLFRILLFKIFNKIETWQLLEESVGGISWARYSFREYDEVLSSAFNRGVTIYSAAYIMTSGKSVFAHERKHQNHLSLLEQIMKSGMCRQVRASNSMAQLYNILLSYPLIGPFLAYQYATDINYSTLTDFSEEEFVKAGPGAQGGITKCFSDRGTYSDQDIIRYMMDSQESEFKRLELRFKDLFGRPLKLIDCQNVFCEVGKYARVSHPQVKDSSGRVRIKQVYRNAGILPTPCFPQKWGLSSAVRLFLKTQGLNDLAPAGK